MTRADEGEGREPGRPTCACGKVAVPDKIERAWSCPCGETAAWQHGDLSAAAHAEALRRAARAEARAAQAEAEVARLTAENQRLHIAFLVLSESGHGGGMYEVQRWFNSGTAKPIPWPGGACFEAWAAEHGIFNCNGTMDLRAARTALEAPHADGSGGSGGA